LSIPIFYILFYFILPVTVASFQTGIDPAYIFVNITP